MAVAVKTKYFESAQDLADYCADAGNNVTTVISIVADNNGKYVLFYT